MQSILFSYRTDAVANFIARKLYRYFVYSNPAVADTTVLTEMATLFKQSNFQLRPLIKALLSSTHFYDAANRGVQIKTPAEFVVGLARQLGLNLPTSGIDSGVGAMNETEQVLIDPPNVAGWPGHRDWINTKSYPQRLKFARALIASVTDAQAQTFVKQFTGYADIVKFVDSFSTFMFPVPITDARKTNYKSILLSGSPDYEWNTIVNNASTCGVRVRSLLNAVMKAPDYHLC
jgi:hypothetical protein